MWTDCSAALPPHREDERERMRLGEELIPSPASSPSLQGAADPTITVPRSLGEDIKRKMTEEFKSQRFVGSLAELGQSSIVSHSMWAVCPDRTLKQQGWIFTLCSVLRINEFSAVSLSLCCGIKSAPSIPNMPKYRMIFKHSLTHRFYSLLSCFYWLAY